MFESGNRALAPASIGAVVAMVLSGCSVSQDGPASPPPPPSVFKAEFNPAGARMPYPIDLYFFDSTDPTGAKADGTLQIVPSSAQGYPRAPAMAAALNSLDGWSTTASITASFNLPLDAATLNGSTVKVVEMYLDNVYKLPIQTGNPVSRVLEYGTDYTVDISPDVDSEGRFLRITPVNPLRHSEGATNVGYMVVLTTGIKSADGKAVEPDDVYAGYKSATSCGATDLLCNTVKAQLAVASSPLLGADAVPAGSIALTWSFTTESVDDTLNYIAAYVPGPTPVVVPTGTTTATFGAFGHANIYAGYTEVPYFLTPSANPKDNALNTGFWVAAGPPTGWPNTASRNLTRFNPVPKQNALLKIPLLVSVPNNAAAGGACTKPANGWPVVIYQHGITTDRSTMIAVADGYADGCMVVAAIDLPLHGITPYANGQPNPAAAIWCNPANPSPLAATCMGARERTFDVDLVAPSAAVDSADYPADIDPSGTHFINLTSPATMRDNLRQAESDLIVFTKSVAKLDLTGDGVADIDPTKIHFNGMSMGGIVGGSYIHFVHDLRTSALNVAGGTFSKMALESDTFRPRINAGVTASLAENSYGYNLFFRDFQAVIDSGDPINHIEDAVAMHPVFMQKVLGDTVVPNAGTDRLIAAGAMGDNTMTRISSGAANAVVPGAGVWVEFPYGTHGSLLTTSPCAALTDPGKTLCQKTTVEMQKELVMYAASSNATGTAYVTVTDPTVVKQ